MLYKKQLLVTGILAITLCACADSETKAHGGVQNPVEDKVWYTNPVIGGNTPDPSVIKADDGYFIYIIQEGILITIALKICVIGNF